MVTQSPGPRGHAVRGLEPGSGILQLSSVGSSTLMTSPAEPLHGAAAGSPESGAGHSCASCRRQITLCRSAVTHIPVQGKCAKVIHCFGSAKNRLGFVLQDVQLTERGADRGRGWGGGEGSRSVSSQLCLSHTLHRSNNSTQHLISPFVEADDVTLIN